VHRAVEQNTGLPHLVGSRNKTSSWLHLDEVF
jgi:hypothetical protein